MAIRLVALQAMLLLFNYFLQEEFMGTTIPSSALQQVIRRNSMQSEASIEMTTMNQKSKPPSKLGGEFTESSEHYQKYLGQTWDKDFNEGCALVRQSVASSDQSQVENGELSLKVSTRLERIPFLKELGIDFDPSRWYITCEKDDAGCNSILFSGGALVLLPYLETMKMLEEPFFERFTHKRMVGVKHFIDHMRNLEPEIGRLNIKCPTSDENKASGTKISGTGSIRIDFKIKRDGQAGVRDAKQFYHQICNSFCFSVSTDHFEFAPYTDGETAYVHLSEELVKALETGNLLQSQRAL